MHSFVNWNLALGSTLYTDDHPSYHGLIDFKHLSVKHTVGEYVRSHVHTNEIDSFWALLTRGYIGIFHHFTWKHLHRYIAEFEMRCNWIADAGAARLDSLFGFSSGIRLNYSELIG